MSCDRCDESRNSGMEFCPYCGTEFNDGVQSAPVTVTKDGKVKKTSGEIFFVFGLLISILLSALIIMELAIALTGIGWVPAELIDNGYVHTLFLVTPYIVKLFTISGVLLAVFYALLIITTLVCVALLFIKSVRPFLNIRKDGGEGARNTPLYEMTVLFALMFAVEIVYIFIIGVSDGGEDTTPVWENMFELLNASVWEEIITRFLIIGVPIAVLYFAIRKDKKELKKAFGGFDSFNPIVVFLIFLSAFIFGAAHLTSGSWGAWKFLPTFFFGLITGYLFVKYGLYATIAMHFLNDYLSSESWFTGMSMMPFTITILLITCVASLPFLYVYGKKIVAFFRKGFDPL